MGKIEDLVFLFFNKPEELTFTESFDNIEVEYSNDDIDIPSKKNLLDVLESFERDRLGITISTDEEDGIHLDWNTNEEDEDIQVEEEEDEDAQAEDEEEEEDDPIEKIDIFLEDLRSLKDLVFDTANGDSISFTLSVIIYKRIDDENRMSFYSFSRTIEFLENTNLSGLMFVFRRFLTGKDFLHFVLPDQPEFDSFFTSTFLFSPRGMDEVFKDIDKNKRKELCKKRNEVAHFLNAADYTFIPEDFYLLKRSNEDSINSIFDKLAIIFLLISLVNVSHLEGDNRLQCQLVGYRRVNQVLDFGDFQPDAKVIKEYLEIYKWVYSGDNINDKIGIARNVITLKIKNDNLLDIEPGAINTIQSNHLIYLKENVQQYIEVKNKISEFIFDMFQKASETVDSFVGTFKNNVTATVSFFISVLIINSVQDVELTKIFTPEISVLSIVFLFLSALFLVFSRKDIRVKCERLESSYAKLKERYKDVLNANDIDAIFKAVKHEEDIDYIRKQAAKYSYLWLLTIIVLLVIVIGLGTF